MVITLKHTLLFLLALVLIQIGLANYFNSNIQEKNTELKIKSKQMQDLNKLEKKYSKENQKKELKRIYDFLSIFDIEYKTKEIRKKKELSIKLTKENANKTISFILNKNINIKSFLIEKIDKHNIIFKVVIL
ncbi:MAG: hypothetical protein U9N02_09240 [Campylobacterota bacterium]|nr:hypothetical protein [Campylobacterota bacterium]